MQMIKILSWVMMVACIAIVVVCVAAQGWYYAALYSILALNFFILATN